MLSIQDNETITRVGPGTPMGELMRHYWQPVCAADELQGSRLRTKQVKILGEELVIYRDRKGNLGVVDKYCTHRRASLEYGVVEDDGIRCQYHGWKFDQTGECTEQPFEDTTHPEDNFRAKCGIRAYPAQEAAGLIFVYMGSGPAPLLPLWEPLTWEQCVRDIAITILPCNWLQCQENSLDPVHLEWLHGYSGAYFKSLVHGEEPQEVGEWEWRHQKIGFDAFPHGIIKRRIYKGQTEEDDEWKVGHPILFPNILLVGNPLSNTLQWRVPIDDTQTLHFSLYSWRAARGKTAPKQETVPSRIVPLTDDDNKFIIDILFNQDYMCWVTQGDIAKRNLEKLGESDKGIIMFRKMLLQQIEAMQETGSPTMNVFHTEEQNNTIALPTEPSRFNMMRSLRYSPSEAGYSRDAEKIEAVMATWKDVSREEVRELVNV